MKILMLILSFCLLSNLAWADVLYGTAKDSNGKVVYLEKHTIETDGDGLNKKILVEYSKEDGDVFAKMISDFKNNKFIPDTVSEIFKNKTKHTLTVKDKTVIFKHFKDDKLIKSKEHKLKENMVASQGFDNFIKANFDELKEKSLPLYFGVLSSLDFFSLTGYPKSDSSDSKSRFGIRASSFFIRMFANELTVEYDPKTKRLLSYVGRSNVPNDEGKSLDVSISYKYESQEK